ncbi:MAG: DUF427 domain-containing protein [Rhodospirillales bacterium]|nr:DUF427 domain-containing protein [Rhodospirillales bacterium]MCB9997038.1 DUF427 domain-containing protein [Rhodospirillales bacterium]
MFAHNISITPVDDKITLTCNGRKIAETQRALKLHEPPLMPVYYIPRDDIDMSLLRPSTHKTTCPHKGQAVYFDLSCGEETLENVGWSYESPKDDVADIKDFIAFFESVVTIEAEDQ